MLEKPNLASRAGVESFAARLGVMHNLNSIARGSVEEPRGT